MPVAILVWLLLKYCCRCCWNCCCCVCCWRCCDCNERCSFLLWVVVCSVNYQSLCRFKTYSSFLLLQQLFIGVWATWSVDLCFCRLKAYSTFFLLQQLLICFWAAGSVALFFGVISFKDCFSWIFMQFQTQASIPNILSLMGNIAIYKGPFLV